jgi:hypothetical protein
MSSAHSGQVFVSDRASAMTPPDLGRSGEISCNIDGKLGATLTGDSGMERGMDAKEAGLPPLGAEKVAVTVLGPRVEPSEQ